MTTPHQPPLLREFIDIPEGMSDSDFVLKLAEGVTDAESTLRDYVITEDLVANFDRALGLIKAAVTGHSSKAAYLHGSFGAGKSHFMAVLHALLRGEKTARERVEFAGLLAKHDWLVGRRFLLVPFHLLDAKSLEHRVLGRYVDYVRSLEPDAPIPSVHRTDALLAQAAHLRARIGDEAFIQGLPGGDEVDEWGDPRPSWTSEQLDSAFAGSHADASDGHDEHPIVLTAEDELRRKLVNELLQTWNTGFFTNAKEDAEGFVSLDRGLLEISRHAKDLGYDALILFLDELVLWLTNSVGDPKFVSREVQKITNFVESGDATRPIPVISLIARQRDLRDLIGEEVVGAVELGFQDTLDLAKSRFDTITLEDRNLPVIAQQRLLTAKDDAAAAALARAFDQTSKVRREVWDTLLGSGNATGADIDAFRRTYPFSPAFMDTLVHISSALQRSRTALKLMRRILIRRRDDLRLGDLIPLGDLYDVISEGGDEPFTQKLKVEFEAAQKLYDTKLRPYLLGRYGDLTEDEIARVRRGTETEPRLAGRVRAFTGDDRLIKTLLLSALAPTVPALHNLTASRLAALNHGSVTSPISGGEVGLVARKVEEWAGQFNEIKFAKADDPGVGLELVGVDIDSILDNARNAGADTTGTRKNLIRKLLYRELGVTETEQYGGDRFELAWRGSKRSVEVVFGNIRDHDDLRDDAFHPADPTSWRVIVDYPFDEGDYTPADDRNRVQIMFANGFRDRTLCWVPASLSAERTQDLRRLVTIEYALHGKRFDEVAKDLNPTDRHRARQTLTGQGVVLSNKLAETLRQAYGLTGKQQGDVVTGFDDHLLSLSEELNPRLPSGASLADAMAGLAGQMLTCQFPAHPDFDPDHVGGAAVVKAADARLVLDYVRKAVEASDGRVEVDKPHRATMRRVANPLLLGEMHEAAFVLGSHWRGHFNRCAAQDRVTGDLKIPVLLDWIDRPERRGLDRLVAYLVIACFAEQTDRSWTQHGGPVNPELAQIRDDMALREESLPGEKVWDTARRRAMEIFGRNPPAARRARLAGLFARELSDDARRHRDAAHDLVAELENRGDMLGLDLDAREGRLRTARQAADLLDGLGSRHGKLEIIEQLASADVGEAPQRVGKSIKSAAAVVTALRTARWDNFAHLADLGEPFSARAELIVGELRQAALADELTLPLAPALARAGSAAGDLIREAIRRRDPVPDPVPDPIGPGPVPKPPPGPRPEVIYSGPVSRLEERLSQLLTDARTLAEAHPDLELRLTDLLTQARALAKADPGADVEISMRSVPRR
ncbi:hypothetical protein ABT352_26020 [Streptosporangium sp. NPDC000563]|uniref:hypothetical protein n=1 Tax=Streptosporangium sp. NPDC000563 TaxID=3154366 RepID=UPI003321A541